MMHANMMRGLVDRPARPFAGPVLAAILAFAVTCGACPPGARAQPVETAEPSVSMPIFIDPNRVFEKPSNIPATITFLTSLDFPPFNFLTPEGRLSGFHVDLAREICEELKVRCQMRIVAFDRIVRSLVDGKGDAAIAGLAENARTRRRLRFTVPYLRMAGRFAASKSKPAPFARQPPDGAWISVVNGSAHAAFLSHYFPNLKQAGFDDPAEARNALKDGAVSLHFGDALSLSFWLQSDDAQDCCAFEGGAYFDRTYFGRGLSIAMPEEATILRATLNYALQRVVATGKFSELYLRYFPISFY